MNVLIGRSRFFPSLWRWPCAPRRRVRALALAFALSLAAPWTGAVKAADDPETVAAALRFIEQHDVGVNMIDGAERVARLTMTFGMIAAELGRDEATRLLRRELAQVRPKYQPLWNRNLANSYARFLTADELRSLDRDGKASPAVPRLAREWKNVSADMKAHSQELLAKYAGEALGNAYNASFAKK